MAIYAGTPAWETGTEGHWRARGTPWGDWDTHEAVRPRPARFGSQW